MFNKETEYALRGLVYIQLQNFKKRRPGTAEIAKKIDAPSYFTAKILHSLVRYGFVESLKGKGGGFFFDPDKSDLPLVKLVSAIEGERSFSGCGFGLKQCDSTYPCPLHKKYSRIRDSIAKLLSEETVQSLAKKIHKKDVRKSKNKK